MHNSNPIIFSGEDTSCDSPVVTGAHSNLHLNKAATTNTTTSSNNNKPTTTNNATTTNHVSIKNSKSNNSGSGHGLSFLRLFHKSSATLQLQHPKAGELNPSMKPYKGTVMTSMDHQRKKKEFLKRKLPLVPMASSSLSSLNTLANEHVVHPVHHKMNVHPGSSNPLRANQVHHSSSNSVISSSGEDSSATTTDGSVSAGTTSRGCSSSSNYDSGAFSRSSSPTEHGGNNPVVHNPNNVSLSMSRLALTEPLVAPRLVLAACRGEWQAHMPALTPEELQEIERQQQKQQKLHQLQMHRKKARARSMSAVRAEAGAEEEQITVSVGANTMLTIGSPESSSNSRLSNLRRSRSGLPVLGTTALRPSPVKPMRSTNNIRTKISTVYLAEAPAPPSSTVTPTPAAPGTVRINHDHVESESLALQHAGGPLVNVNRSSSIVTVMGSKPAGVKCDCNERVTVNGQHHCVNNCASGGGSNPASKVIIRDLNNQTQCSSLTTTTVVRADTNSAGQTGQTGPSAKVVDRSTNTTPINVLVCNNNTEQSAKLYQNQQPSSIIEI